MLALGFAFLSATGANADTRSLKLYNMHTREKAEIVFKRNGRFDSSGLRQLNQFLRDWRRNEPTKMDPRLFDLIWEAYRSSGSNDYIHVVCGYRSPQTNSMLRSRSKGVAKKSQHMLGKAMDFFIPDVKLKRLREIGLKMQGGGVGYYPTSGSPFVHFDVGNVRHWPKMSRRELIALFPDGKTLHVPSDGKPLPGFNQALASYQARKKSGNVAIASLSKSNSGSSRSGSLLAAFFGGGGGADDEEDSSGVNVASAGDDDAAAPAQAPQPKATIASTKATATAKADNKIRILPPELANPVDLPAAAQQEAIVAALPARDVPLPLAAPRPQVDVGAVDQSSPGLYAAGDQPPADGQPAADGVVALNVPLPMPRPGNAPPPELDLAAQQDRAVMVAAATSDSASDMDLPLPVMRPDDPAVDEIAPLISASSDEEPDDGEDSYTVASVPVAGSAGDAFPIAPDEIIPAAKATDPTLLGYADTPRSALVTRAPGADPAFGCQVRGQDDGQVARALCAKTPSATPSRRSSRRSRKPRAGRSTAPTWTMRRAPPRSRHSRIIWCVRRRAKSTRQASSKARGRRRQPLHRQGSHLHDDCALQHELIAMRRRSPAPPHLQKRSHFEARVAASRASFSISAQSPDLTASSGAIQEPPTQITFGSDK